MVVVANQGASGGQTLPSAPPRPHGDSCSESKRAGITEVRCEKHIAVISSIFRAAQCVVVKRVWGCVELLAGRSPLAELELCVAAESRSTDDLRRM